MNIYYLRRSAYVACILLLFVYGAVCQTETATVSGIVTDSSGAVVLGADVQLQSIERGTATNGRTNSSGFYVFAGVQPGQYHVVVRKLGFRQLDFLSLIVNVQDHIEQNFRLQVGSVSESITVEGSTPLINATDASVSTVVDRNFAENLPMNGRSFQTLIQLTPGVVLTPSNVSDGGQFSVNGQRSASNYWMVDGVSANTGIGVNINGNPGNGLGGALQSFSVLGGTNSLVSVDAMQEFRIQTSTYAPEFGRTPGGQISIVTRSGGNQFHGAAFDYFRNDLLDASNWFNGYTNTKPLPKAKERQNDFGGTLSGPLLKDRTFFFVSYEGLRLRLPQTTTSTVPDLTSRQNAVPAMRPYLNAFPLPNGVDDLISGVAQFNATYSNPATLDAYGIRLDHKLNDRVHLFARYNYSPSITRSRGGAGFDSLSELGRIGIKTHTATAGVSWGMSQAIDNDLRANYSSANASSSSYLDKFHGDVPIASPGLPDPFTADNALFRFDIFSLQNGEFNIGKNGHNVQHQINIVDGLSLQAGLHSLKVGVDYRRLTPMFDPDSYLQGIFFNDVPSAENGTLFFSVTGSNVRATLRFQNIGIYAQDTWRMNPRLTLTYGVRWDVDSVPKSLKGPSLPAVTGYSLTNLSNLSLASPGVAPYETTYANFAPRIGLAYRVVESQDRQTVLRGGFGVFYDLASSEVGNHFGFTGNYPFGSAALQDGGMFPLSAQQAAPPPITPPSATNSGFLSAFNPHLQLPYTLEWNVALEQGLGKQQTISASYIGSAGRRLLQTAVVYSPSPNLFAADLITNAGMSDYNGLQLQFQRRLAHGLQVLASYTWAHSIDTSSAGSAAVSSNAYVPSAIGNSSRGPSDFDVRNSFSAGLTYVIPGLKKNKFTNTALGGWTIDNIFQAHSATPVEISAVDFSTFNGGNFGDIRPDVVPGQPLYLKGSQCASAPQYAAVLRGARCPGGKGINPGAFADPPKGINGNPLRQGTLGRNALRGFGAFQWDFAAHRDFSIHESLKLQFRAELFNVLNHPNFGPMNGQFGTGGFGLSTQMLGQSLNGGSTGTSNVSGGAFSPLYQIGGPRSVQLALSLLF